MKRHLPVLMMLCLLMGSCSKEREKTQVNPTPVVDPNAMKFSITGITDMSLDATDDTTIALGIAHTGGKQEKLTLSVIDLPANVSATFETPSGIPSFASFLKYHTDGAAGGNHKIKIKAVTASDSVSTYEVVLKITPAVDPYACMKDLPGTYKQNGTSNLISIEAVAGTKDQLKIMNIPGVSHSIIAVADCGTQKLAVNVGDQPAGSPVIGGQGTFNSTGDIELSYDILINGGSQVQTKTLYLDKQ